MLLLKSYDFITLLQLHRKTKLILVVFHLVQIYVDAHFWVRPRERVAPITFLQICLYHKALFLAKVGKDQTN